jgi:carbonic anhydrase
MRVPFRLTLVLAAVLASAAAQASEAGPAVVVAQLSGVPSSPGFKMTVNKGETGAPEPTAVGARPIEKKGAAHADEHGKTEEHAKADEHGKPAEHGKAEEKVATKSEGKGEKAEAKGEKTEKSAKAEAKSEKGGAEGKDAKAAAGSMDDLRERLAAKLGARPADGKRYAMQVSNRGESGENVIAAVRPSAAAVRRAKKPAAPASAAEGDANMDIAAHAGTSLLPTHWDYEGAGGPGAWAKLKPEYAKCASGTRQSPIDIRGGISVDLEPIKFDYRTSGFSVIDNGHTVQVNVEPGNAITITGRRYELVQFHFHRPSEERINGRQYDMVMHLVHKDPEGKLAVVAVLLDRGSVQPLIQTVWNNLPLEKGEEVRAGARIDLAQLLPQDKRYYTYMGSLTTPPCSEGVLWMVMKQPVPISVDQVGIFAHLYPMNARPIQQAEGRLIKESN